MVEAWRKEQIMYSLYPLGFVAGFLILAMMNYMDKYTEVKSVKVEKRL